MITRRKILGVTLQVGAAVSFSAALPGLGLAAQPLPLRRSLLNMDLDDPILDTWREFVAIMKDPSRDGQPVSWGGFSDIHGMAAGGFNLCPHGNWYFLPWHRGYIRMYEAAVRALTGNSDFAMPYWDWTVQPDFPAALGDPMYNGNPNPLFVPGRRIQTGDRVPTDNTGPDIMESIYSNTTYEEFGSSRPRGQNNLDSMWIMRRGTQGELESNPHNSVHCIVAGPFMCSAPSPQDPAFQMHHCNIDRIWAEWNFRGGSNSSNNLWRDMPFTNNFIDPAGNRYTDTVKDLFDVEDLGYSYGLGDPREPLPDDLSRNLLLAALFGTPLALESADMTRVIKRNKQAAAPDNPLSISLQTNRIRLSIAVSNQRTSAMEAAGLPKRKVYAFIRQIDATKSDSTQLRVFVNVEGSGKPNEYVGPIAFFGPGGIHHGNDMRPSVGVDLTPALRRIADGQPLTSDSIKIELVSAALNEGDTPGDVAPAEIELAIV